VVEKEYSIAVKDLLCTFLVTFSIQQDIVFIVLMSKRLFRSITDHMCHVHTVNSLLGLSSYLTEKARIFFFLNPET